MQPVPECALQLVARFIVQAKSGKRLDPRFGAVVVQEYQAWTIELAVGDRDSLMREECAGRGMIYF
jgi:hypothetical protein